MMIDIEPVDPIEVKDRLTLDHMKEIAAWASGHKFSIYHKGEWRLIRSIRDFFRSNKIIRRGVVINDYAIGYIQYMDGFITPFTYPLKGYQRIKINDQTTIDSNNGDLTILEPKMGERILITDTMMLDVREISSYSSSPAHPQYDVIKAWSEGEMIMERDELSGEWCNVDPDWNPGVEYAINGYMYRNPVFRVYRDIFGDIKVAKNYRIPVDFNRWVQEQWTPA